MSAAVAESAVAEAERVAAGAGGELHAQRRRVALAAVSDSLAERALEELLAVQSGLGVLDTADAAALVRSLIEGAEADRAAAESGAASAAAVVDAAVGNARRKVAESAADEVAAVPHRCVEEPAVPWPAGRGTIEVEVLAVRGAIAEIGVDAEHVSGVLEAVREGRVVGFVAARDDGGN